MILLHFLFTIFFSALAILIFTTLFRTKGPWNNLVLFFIVIFLSTWAGGIWLYPFGPYLWGITWLPFLLAAIFITVLLIAATPPPEETTVELIDQNKKEAEKKMIQKSVSAFFMVIIIALVVAIIGRYYI
jgi:hypothetical protein